MKKLANLKGAKALNKEQQKSINGGGPDGPPVPTHDCYFDTDPICCGTAQWQCGTGPYSGGYYVNGGCVCA